MFELIYTIFFVVLIAEVLVFLFLTLPTPRGWKGTVVNFLNTNPSVQNIRRAHLGFCVIAALFLWDSISNSSKFYLSKEQAKAGDSLAAGTFRPTQKWRAITFHISLSNHSATSTSPLCSSMFLLHSMPMFGSSIICTKNDPSMKLKSKNNRRPRMRQRRKNKHLESDLHLNKYII